jgi:dethiobiotin synthetase
MAKGFFVTGTDTNIGKTVLSALLCSSLPARYWKPIQTGASEGSDRQQVIRLSGMAPDLAAPEAYVFDDPVSPHLAAQRTGVRSLWKESACQNATVIYQLLWRGPEGSWFRLIEANS